MRLGITCNPTAIDTFCNIKLLFRVADLYTWLANIGRVITLSVDEGIKAQTGVGIHSTQIESRISTNERSKISRILMQVINKVTRRFRCYKYTWVLESGQQANIS